ncbi:MAG: sensor histidine kinase, partial [Anaerolineae bacterium]
APAAHTDLERSQAVSRRLVEMQEAERRRVARELHDEVGQALTAVKINLQALEHQNPDPLLAARLKDSIAVVERALQQVRNIALDLRPSLLDDLGLVPALRWYVDNQARRVGLAASFTATPADLRLPPHLETHCFRMAQEAITNVIRHAHATRMDVILNSTGHGVRLIVRDNGVGFNVARALEQSMRGKSMGLSSLRERAALAGGRVDIFSQKDRGTEVRAWFPNEPDAEEKGSVEDPGA